MSYYSHRSPARLQVSPEIEIPHRNGSVCCQRESGSTGWKGVKVGLRLSRYLGSPAFDEAIHFVLFPIGDKFCRDTENE